MGKIENLRKQLEITESEIKRLSDFRNTPALRAFIRRLQGEASFIKSQIASNIKSKEEKEKEKRERLDKANRNRRSKNKRNWNYVRAIQENYRPDLSLNEIRSLLKKHRQGLETDVPDVAWRNPSP